MRVLFRYLTKIQVIKGPPYRIMYQLTTTVTTRKCISYSWPFHPDVLESVLDHSQAQRQKSLRMHTQLLCLPPVLQQNLLQNQSLLSQLHVTQIVKKTLKRAQRQLILTIIVTDAHNCCGSSADTSTWIDTLNFNSEVLCCFQNRIINYEVFYIEADVS